MLAMDDAQDKLLRQQCFEHRFGAGLAVGGVADDPVELRADAIAFFFGAAVADLVHHQRDVGELELEKEEHAGLEGTADDQADTVNGAVNQVGVFKAGVNAFTKGHDQDGLVRDAALEAAVGQRAGRRVGARGLWSGWFVCLTHLAFFA